MSEVKVMMETLAVANNKVAWSRPSSYKTSQQSSLRPKSYKPTQHFVTSNSYTNRNGGQSQLMLDNTNEHDTSISAKYHQTSTRTLSQQSLANNTSSSEGNGDPQLGPTSYNESRKYTSMRPQTDDNQN